MRAKKNALTKAKEIVSQGDTSSKKYINTQIAKKGKNDVIICPTALRVLGN
jgi:hypothetical protein